jgi:hypothetical protein
MPFRIFQRTVTFAKRTKNGKNTIAPLTDRALDVIDSIPELPGCRYVFCNPQTGTRAAIVEDNQT